MVDTKTLDELKASLTQELAVLEVELTDIGKADTLNKGDWHGTTGSVETGTADAQLLADRFEESLTNEGITSDLEKRYADVKLALERITAGTYGTCTEGGEEIPLERLKANPAATTCITHAQ